MNPEKTNGGNLISSFACSPETAADDFLLFRQAYQMNTGRSPQNEVIAYHVRQAFKPGEVTPEEANEIGRELAETITGNHHAFVVATHIDKSHVHNHLIFSSVDLDGQHKFRDVKRSAKDVVAISDALCTDHGLSVIREPQDKTVSYDRWQGLELFIVTGLSKKVDDIMKDLRIKAQVKELPPQSNRIHVRNGTLFTDGRFVKEEQTWKVCEAAEIVRSRFPVLYNPDAEPPGRWMKFLSDLLWPEDIPTLQEFIGYCLIPSNAGQKMLIIKGSGGEGKSQIGYVLSRMFGENAKDGSVGKVSENRFARADLEHIYLMIDDDMRLEALKQTNYVKSIVTAKGKMDL